MDQPREKIFEEPFPWPPQDEDIRAALLAAWEDGSWGKYHADHTTRLEEALRTHHGVEHVALCCSGTMAVELALRGGKISAGDEVILAAYDFPGNFRAIEAVGARPVLIDLAAGSWCLDVAQIEDALGPNTKAILASHLHGTLADMPAIMDIARRRGLFVVEDACQMHGGMVAGKPAGSWGDAGVLSFGGSKLITAGRGGAVLTSCADVLQRIKVFADRGNETFPLSQLQAAVLLPQWNKLTERNRLRAQQVSRLLAATQDLTHLVPASAATNSENQPAYYKLAWRLPAEEVNRERWLMTAQDLGLLLDAGFRGFARRGQARCRTVGDLKQAQQAARSTIVLHHPILLQPEVVIDRLAEGLRVLAALMTS